MAIESVKVPPIDDLLQAVREFSTSELVSTAEFNAMELRLNEVMKELDGCIKDETGLRSALQHRQGTIKHLRSELTTLSYRIREMKRSPFSPLKSHFRSDLN